MSPKLNRDSSVPLYYQLEAFLEDRILRGVWKAGDPIPSERQICAEFDVSRAVVRPALEILEYLGFLTRSQGRTTRVSPPRKTAVMGGLLALLSDSSGERLETKVIDVGVEAVWFGRNVTEPTVGLHATGSIDGEPVCITRSSLAIRPLAKLIQRVERGLPLRPQDVPGAVANGSLEVELEAGICTEFEARHLGLTVGDPVFVVRATHFRGRSGAPVEAAWTMYRAATRLRTPDLRPSSARAENGRLGRVAVGLQDPVAG